MADRSITARFDAKVDGYLSGVAKMEGATDKFAKSASASAAKHRADWDKVGKAAVVSGAVIGAVVVGAAKAYMDFEKAMSGVAAVADANQTQLKQLATAAREAGKATVFSATEAAQAEAELAKAGVSVSDIMGGALTGSLSLAAAGQIDLADAATISAQAMNIFKLNGKDVGHIADVLTAGANKSAAGVDDLGLALQQGGLVAKQTGLNLEDTVGTLSAFADNALRGSDAGTSLKTMLQRLNPQSQQAADLMDELGLRAYDAQGNFVGITAYAGKLQTALKGMSAEQRNAALSTLFGSDAVRGASILYEQGAAGIQKYINAVNDQGAAQRMAARQTDNLAGDIEKLKGALQDAFIGAGSGGNAGIRSLVQDVTNLVDKFGELPPSTQANVVKFAALSSALLLVAGGGIKATTSILALKTAMEGASIAGVSLTNVTKTLAAVAAVVGLAEVSVETQKLMGEAQTATVAVDDLASSLDQLNRGGQLVGGIAVLFRDKGGLFQAEEGFVSTGEAIKRFADQAKAALPSGFWADFQRGFLGTRGEVDQFDKTVRQLDAGLAQMVSEGHADQAKAALDKLLSGLNPAQAEAARAKFTEFSAALDTAAVSATSTKGAIDPMTGSVKDAWKSEKDLADAAKAAAEAHDQLIKAVESFGQKVLDARSAARDYQAALDDATKSVKDNGRTLDVHTAKGRANQVALEAIRTTALKSITANAEHGASLKSLDRQVDAARSQFITFARQMGLSRAQANTLANQLGLTRGNVNQLSTAIKNTPTKHTTQMDARTEAARAKIDGLQRAINSLTGKTVNIYTNEIITTTRRTNAPLANSMQTANQYATGNAYRKAGGGSVSGPGSKTSDSIPAWLSNGEFVVKAAAVDKYGPPLLHAINDMRFAGGGMVGAPKFASGGQVDFSDIMSILGDVTTWDDVLKARGTRASKAQAVKAAKAALDALIEQRRKLQRDLASARRAGDHAKVNDLLGRQHVLVSKIAAAEGRLAIARNASAAAAKKAHAAEVEYKADKRPLIDRTIGAATTSAAAHKKFLDNIAKLQKMGFGRLAADLLSMGSDSPEARALAEQAAKSAVKAKQLQGAFASSAAMDAREAGMKAAMDAKAALAAASMSALFPGVKVGTGLPTAALPPVYVQNPFTGDYLLAQVGNVADQQVAQAGASAGRGW